MTKESPYLEAGESYVEGRGAEAAQQLIDAAKDAGLEISVVRTTNFGYIVPSEIAPEGAHEGPHHTTVESGRLHVENPEAEAEAEVGDENPEGKQFDPDHATIDEVKEYLEHADDTERERVLAAEAEGKKRKGVLDLASTPEGAK